ncbi:MAG: hypothetical protein ACO1RT_05350 [Planctomycetaceae bacterium]
MKGSSDLSPPGPAHRDEIITRVDAAHLSHGVTPGSIAQHILHSRLPADTIRERQSRIHAEVLQLSRSMDKANFTRLDGDDLRRMTMLYDREFFDSRLLALIGRERIRFGFSSRMTRVAGKLVTHYGNRKHRRVPSSQPPAADDRRFEMVLSSTLLFQAFHDVDRPIVVTGLRCRNRLEAMQRVCEHELVHLLEMFLWNDSSCSQDRFQSVAHRLFGHTEHQHDLITQSERAARNFDIRVGSIVRFKHDDAVLTGWVNRITRRATVLVENRSGERFSDGRRYVRFYVPLEKLTLIQPNGCVGESPQSSPW